MRAVPEGLELEARELEHDDVVPREPVDLLDDRMSDVAPHEHRARPEREHALDQRCGRCLSLGAGDPDDRRRTQAEEERHLGQHRDALFERAKDRRRAGPDTRDHEHEIGIRERLVVTRRAELELDGKIAEPRHSFRELLAGLGIGDRDVRAFPYEEARQTRGRPALAESDDRHAASREFVRPYLGIEEQSQSGRLPLLPMKPSCVP